MMAEHEQRRQIGARSGQPWPRRVATPENRSDLLRIGSSSAKRSKSAAAGPDAEPTPRAAAASMKRLADGWQKTVLPTSTRHPLAPRRHRGAPPRDRAM